MIGISAVNACLKHWAEPHEELVAYVCNEDAYRIWSIRRDRKGKVIGSGSSHVSGQEIDLRYGNPEELIELLRDRVDIARSTVAPHRRWPFSVRIGRRKR